MQTRRFRKISVTALRKISQVLFLIAFLFLFVQTESKGGDELGVPARIFLDFDPLIFISSLLASHTITVAFYFSLILIALTALLGRVFCGWVCPLGTLHDTAAALKNNKTPAIHLQWFRAKYYILLFILASSLFTLQPAGILDPISLLIRSLSISLYPAFNYMVRAVFDTIYHWNPPGIVDLSEALYTVFKKSILSFQQPYFQQGSFVGLLFVLVLGLNLIERRFWCRYLCPLGALLGLFSRYALLRRSVSEGCNECSACATLCKGGALSEKGSLWKGTECLYCMNCDDPCPRNAVVFGFTGGKRPSALDLGRRNVAFAMISGILSVPLLRIAPFAKTPGLNPELIRPPGALEEKEFLRRCIKCGECMKVCITNGLQPTLFDAGLEGIWSPVLIPRIGYCEYRCTLCGQVCPTGAIEKLTPEKKAKIRIGLAMIDPGRCLPYAQATPCLVCEEVCPTAKKAIRLETAPVKDKNGNTVFLKQPKVDIDLCIGCGICETRCPISGRPAIYVTSTGESRSNDNQLLLL
jgi:polyferredoxin/ferredoxin